MGFEVAGEVFVDLFAEEAAAAAGEVAVGEGVAAGAGDVAYATSGEGAVGAEAAAGAEEAAVPGAWDKAALYARIVGVSYSPGMLGGDKRRRT
jgi:hypothetical protein